MIDFKALARITADVVRSSIAAAIEPVNARLLDFEVRLRQAPAGKDGKAGERGEMGPSGPQGPAGERGEKGEPGERGAGGPQGDAGPAGADGAQGARGGAGEKGADGREGKDGRDGREGKDGAPGRDALELEILSAIQPGRSYPRGTFASHAGGLIRAVRNTDALPEGATASLDAAGWTVVVDGIRSLEVVEVDDRSFIVTCGLTSGAAVAQAIAIPALIYREVYRANTAYQRGDVVTYGGHAWHCQEATSELPGTSKAWRLMVKAGRDGKDGSPGERGPAGRDGRAL